MLISHRKRFVLLAPWKAATQTTRARLGAFCESPYSSFYELNPILRRVVHQHMTYSDFAALPESRLGYRTAAFVRNPYDRVYSGFRQLQKDLEGQPLRAYPSDAVRRLVMSQLTDNFRQLSEARFQFEPWLELVREEQILETGHNSSFPLHPAHYWTHHNGVQAVDFIGRVENFESDFTRLCAELDVEPTSQMSENVDASPEELGGDQNGYRYAAEMSPSARARIHQLFHEDFELFGYESVP